jgi:hypothetical protein
MEKKQYCRQGTKRNEHFIITQLNCTKGILQAYIQVLAKINKVTNS